MVADSDLPYFRGYSRQRGRGFGALAQTIGRTAIPFCTRNWKSSNWKEKIQICGCRCWKENIT